VAQALIIHGNAVQAAALAHVLQLAGLDVEIAADTDLPPPD